MMKKSGVVVLICLAAFTAWGASDEQWTFEESGTSSYVITYVSSPEVYSGPLGAADPSLTLQETKRYEVTILDPDVHPFQIIAKGATSGNDVVLLSQGSGVGSLESEGEVDWFDDGASMNGKMEFTLTASLVAAMQQGGRTPGYRCSIHSSTMRGDFVATAPPPPPDIADPIAPHISAGSARIELETVVSGLAAPLGLVFPDSTPDRFLVFDQIGIISLWDQGTLVPTPFLDVQSRLVSLGIAGPGTYDERGLLGFALHPAFSSNGKCYTYTSEPVSGVADFPQVGGTPDHQSVLAEWTVNTGDPNTVNMSSRRELMRIDEPQFNHNGGALRFGPNDGYLYLALGDGGNADDEGDGHSAGGNGQDLNKILGKIVRIDVDGGGTPSANGEYGIPLDNPFVGVAGIDEIYAYGFRNPFSMNFDLVSGNLYVGDVGQNKIEEVDIAVAGGNFGWPVKEGTFYFHGNGAGDGYVSNEPEVLPVPSNLVDPIAQYDHDDGSAIMGGYIYFGSVGSLYGHYVTGDFGTSFGTPSGRLFYLDSGQTFKEIQIGFANEPLGYWLKGFGEGPDGALYVCGSKDLGPTGSTGTVLRVAPFEGTLPVSSLTGKIILALLVALLAAWRLWHAWILQGGG